MALQAVVNFCHQKWRAWHEVCSTFRRNQLDKRIRSYTVFKIDEDATFERCVLLDGRELDGDWWIIRPLGVLGSSGILMAQDRATGNLAPLSSVMMLVAKVA